MDYISTRGRAPVLGFQDAMLAGLADDGGLYVPQSWPQISAQELRFFAGKPFHEVAHAVLTLFVGNEIPQDVLARLTREAYAGFHHPATCPMKQLAPNEFVLELFHGPTLAFKDVAMQLLARLMDYVLEQRKGRTTIVCATSGDTGGAAIDAFAGRERSDVFVLFPHGRVSDVQRRQMTTSTAANVFPIAVDGTFDTCQALVKSMFGHVDFKEKVALSGVNSINWARILAQIVYYITAAVALGAPHRAVSFCVPTGNFGDIFAGFVAQRMGLPIERLIIASNENDILTRCFETGRYELRAVVASSSPSMDIQVSSNFERLLFELYDRDAVKVSQLMDQLTQQGQFTIDPPQMLRMKELFSAYRADEAEVAAMIRQHWEQAAYLLDPHTGVACVAAQKYAQHAHTHAPMVVLSTAHPAKFPAAVEAACGVHPHLPAALADLFERTERYERLPADLTEIERYVLAHARITRVGTLA